MTKELILKSLNEETGIPIPKKPEKPEPFNAKRKIEIGKPPLVSTSGLSFLKFIEQEEAAKEQNSKERIQYSPSCGRCT